MDGIKKCCVIELGPKEMPIKYLIKIRYLKDEINNHNKLLGINKNNLDRPQPSFY